MKPNPIEIKLARIVDALEADIIAASDDDIAAAVADLGIKPHMKGSIALADLIYGRADARFGDGASYEDAPGEQRDSPSSQSPNAVTPLGAKGRSHRDH